MASDAMHDADAVRCRTLVVQPEDAVMPTHGVVETAARAIPGARLIKTPGAAISSHLEDRDVAVPIVLEWLAAVDGEGHAGPDRDGIAGLTPRELEVVQQIASGRTNLEIAEALSISRWTVQRHVSNAMRQSDAANRAALAALLSRGGGSG